MAQHTDGSSEIGKKKTFYTFMKKTREFFLFQE